MDTEISDRQLLGSPDLWWIFVVFRNGHHNLLTSGMLDLIMRCSFDEFEVYRRVFIYKVNK